MASLYFSTGKRRSGSEEKSEQALQNTWSKDVKFCIFPQVLIKIRTTEAIEANICGSLEVMAAEHQNGDSHNELDIPGDLTYELARGLFTTGVLF
jgi:hypothetical protein